jgi:preprotein translocase subunit SecD
MKETVQRSIITLMLLTTMFCLNNCTPASNTNTVIKITKTLANSFLIFSETVDIINKLTSTLTNNTRGKLTVNLKQGAFEDVAKEWEKTWKEIRKKISKLEVKYIEIQYESQTYFRKLRELENATSDESLKAIMKRKTDTKEREYETAKNNAFNEIEKIKKMAKAGEDFHNALLQDVMLTQINYRISELNKIEAEARYICSRLNQFAQTGTLILK